MNGRRKVSAGAWTFPHEMNECSGKTPNLHIFHMTPATCLHDGEGGGFNFFDEESMNIRLSVYLFVAALSLPFVVQAGGLHFYEMGTTDLGLAAAGLAARAEDASTVYSNPAGMTRLSGDQISFGLEAYYADAEYKQNGSGLLSGSDPGNVGGAYPKGSFFYSHSVSDRFKLGLGFYANFGLALDFGPWAGSRYVEEVYSKAVSFQPTAAYRLNDQWSVGGGLVMSYGYTGIERTDAANIHYKQDDQDWSYGWRLGVMYAASESTRIGFVWQSKIEHDYDMTPAIAGGYADVLAKVVRPEERMLSIWHQATPAWAVMGNVGWQRWSQFRNYGLQNRSAGAYPGNPDLSFRDTWHAAIGAQYAISSSTKWNVGTAYDTSMYKSQHDTSLIMPNGAVWRLGTGIQHKLTKRDEVGFAVEYLRAESSYDQHRAVSGGYDHPQLYFASLHYMRKF
ncbi:MAG: hypothetical protein C4516_00945 [Oxalobacter sp.]|nr:MAG: hypothetical protein C4516_00945 [Oxalobacter sp.]